MNDASSEARNAIADACFLGPSPALHGSEIDARVGALAHEAGLSRLLHSLLLWRQVARLGVARHEAVRNRCRMRRDAIDPHSLRGYLQTNRRG